MGKAVMNYPAAAAPQPKFEGRVFRLWEAARDRLVVAGAGESGGAEWRLNV